MSKNTIDREVLVHRVSPRAEDIRGPFLRDQTAIIHSLPFRRLKHKTQVFFAPENDHICTRIEHVMHVATIAATIARGLNRYGWDLDEDLAFAIGLGHDLGHAPFGHSGEAILDDLLKPYGERFVHEVNGLRVVDLLANDGEGLNLTFAVRDGIICHNGEKFEQALKPAVEANVLEKITDRNCRPSTFEGCIMRFADKIAYLGRDIEDGMDAGVINEADIPPRIRSQMGSRNGEIIHTLVINVIEATRHTDAISLSPEMFELINELKVFNYNQIYLHPGLKEYESYCRKILRQLFEHLMEVYSLLGDAFDRYDLEKIPLNSAFGKYLSRMTLRYEQEKAPAWRKVVDYLSGMTDLYALQCIKQITLPPPLRFPGH